MVSRLTLLATALLLAACAPPATPISAETPSIAPQSSRLPLSDPGPWAAGWRRMIELAEPGSIDHKVVLTIWYPAAPSVAMEASASAVLDAAPDLSGAPFPLILTATKVGMYFGPHLASHGFVVAGINGQDSMSNWGPWLIDHPRQLLFALDQIAAQGVTGLEGMIDTDHVGAMGYSFGSPTALMLGGARVDPANYLQMCADAASASPPLEKWWIDYNCNLLGGWEAFVANAGPEVTTGEQGLWAPVSDERIRAVIPMVPEGDWLFGERGLAFVDRPTLIFAASQDTVNPYALEAIPIYGRLPASKSTMISFVDEGHMMIDSPTRLAQMEHFAVAFFGFHLKGEETFEDYLSEDFIGGYSDLAWGVYSGQ